MKKISTSFILLTSFILFALMGAIYSFTTSKIYSSKSHVAIFRLKIENPEYNSDESRNRWIWIRDGLNLKSALVPDDLLKLLVEKNNAAKKLSVKYPTSILFFDALRKMINIQFTGADENNFIIEVKSISPELSFDLNTLIFERIRYLAVTADKDLFSAVIFQIKAKQKEFLNDKVSYNFYEDKIRKMTFNHILEQKQKEDSFKIIAPPSLNTIPAWPKPFLLIGVFSFLGLVWGLALDFILKNYLNKNA